MSSSTSSSSKAADCAHGCAAEAAVGRPATELKVLAVAAAVLLVAEAVMRLWGPSLSGELREFASLPARARALSQRDATRVVILGNSLTADGLERQVLEQELARAIPGELALEQVTLNASQYREWHYLFQNGFLRQGARPDYLVLNFNAHRNLDDGNRELSLGRLANFTRWSDLPELFQSDVRSLEQRCEFVQSKLSASFASRSRVRKALHLKLIPGYAEGAARVNAALQASAEPAKHVPGNMPGNEAAPAPAYQRLIALLDLAEKNNVRVIVVGMPVREDAVLDRGLRELLASRGGAAIDLSRAPGVSAGHFRDHAHLNPAGARAFTPVYARRLGAAIVSCQRLASREATTGEKRR